MLLGNRIKFVVVTSSTLDSRADKRVHRIGHHFISVNVASNTTIDLSFRNFDVTDEIQSLLKQILSEIRLPFQEATGHRLVVREQIWHRAYPD